MKNEHILPEFTEPVTALPDQPNLPPDEMKRRLQAPAEELRQAHNALAADHAALHGRVEGIVAQTYGGMIHEAMLDEPLAAKLNGKAEQAALEAAESRITAAETAVAQKCRCYFGSYTGNNIYPRTIELGFKPKAVLIVPKNGYMSYSANGNPYYYGGMALDGENGVAFAITDTGFQILKLNGNIYTNTSGSRYFFLALQ